MQHRSGPTREDAIRTRLNREFEDLRRCVAEKRFPFEIVFDKTRPSIVVVLCVNNSQAIFRITATIDFPFAPLRVTCIDSQFCFPSIADGRDMIFDILKSEWFASCTFIEILKRLPSFAESIYTLSLTSPRHVLVGHFDGFYDLRHYAKDPNCITFLCNKIQTSALPSVCNRPIMSSEQLNSVIAPRIAVLTEGSLILIDKLPPVSSADKPPLLPRVFSWRHLGLLSSITVRPGLGLVELIFKSRPDYFEQLAKETENIDERLLATIPNQDVRIVLDFHPWYLPNHPALMGFFIKDGKLKVPSTSTSINQAAGSSANSFIPAAVLNAMPPPVRSAHQNRMASSMTPPSMPFVSNINSANHNQDEGVYIAPKEVQEQVNAFAQTISRRADALGLQVTDQSANDTLGGVSREITRLKASSSSTIINPSIVSRLAKLYQRKIELMSSLNATDEEVQEVLEDMRVTLAPPPSPPSKKDATTKFKADVSGANNTGETVKEMTHQHFIRGEDDERFERKSDKREFLSLDDETENVQVQNKSQSAVPYEEEQGTTKVGSGFNLIDLLDAEQSDEDEGTTQPCHTHLTNLNQI